MALSAENKLCFSVLNKEQYCILPCFEQRTAIIVNLPTESIGMARTRIMDSSPTLAGGSCSSPRHFSSTIRQIQNETSTDPLLLLQQTPVTEVSHTREIMMTEVQQPQAQDQEQALGESVVGNALPVLQHQDASPAVGGVTFGNLSTLIAREDTVGLPFCTILYLYDEAFNDELMDKICEFIRTAQVRSEDSSLASCELQGRESTT